MPGKLYDCIIVGGGPAGESAAIYLARFNRSVLVIDRGGGRTNTYELNENYLGFPFGIKARRLWEIGKTQAERFGAKFIDDEVESVKQLSVKKDLETARFQVKTRRREYESRSLLFATGVTDLYPNLPDHARYLGKSLFWCITCDGYKTRQKKVVIVGDDDEAACTAMQFLNYTSKVTLLTNYLAGQEKLSDTWRQRLEGQIPIIEAEIKSLIGEDGWLSAIETDQHEQIAADFLFNMSGAVPNNSLPTSLGVKVNGEGYLETSDEQRTSVPFVYAAGDVTRMFSHQIATAVHEGSMAAQAANYDLYRPEQRLATETEDKQP